MLIKIAPSILSADFGKLAEDVARAEAGGADMLHIDIMDGHFVPNISFGPPIVSAIRGSSKLLFDVHLMISRPQDYVDAFAKAGADLLTVHAETAPHLHRVLQTIKDKGLKTGVALNPSTPLSAVEEVLTEVDMVLIMTVNPGFGGQKFIPQMLDKISRLRRMLDERQLTADIQVDGGINATTARQAIAAGANILVAGSAVYDSPDVAKAISDIRGA